ncbi:vesicle transport protein USE1 [Harmonia axyridis]|uniref:vesicle transport protein USE1 n=1 Tax=Harmonia axyridis TaxID=115357 RepID=UPI001E2775EE|nr:vesicle transport protein USE1 [Harmonia axyridis]XP_045465178.1 vesicle transport protein USE1 [Harmonia axyridis]
MSLLSRPEINLRRLLTKCEVLTKINKNDEKFPKYISSLEEMLLEVKKLIEPSNNAIKNYQIRINALKSELGITIDETENYQSMREDLLNLRHRNVNKSVESDDLDQLINYNENIQQKVADNLLVLTKNLKEQSQLANKIIKKDTEVLARSSVLTDQNKAKLEVESSKLEEHSKRAWKCWMWVMLFMVMVVFFTMVMFIKVTKKKY